MRAKGKGRRTEREVFGIVKSRWKTAAEITCKPRTLKARVRAFNDKFGTDEEHNIYIISGNLGYRLTNDKQEILDSIAHEEKLAKIRFRQASRRKKKAYDFFTDNERLPI
jgi:hypothetical protein